MRALYTSIFAAGLVLAPVSAFAMGGGGGADAPAQAAKTVDPAFTAGKAAIDRKNWTTAIQSFEQVVAKDARNADAFNYLGFAYRNEGNYDAALKHYASALQIDPKHKGAHEYVGEAHLKMGNIAKAEEHLKALDGICVFGCAEYTELKTKVAAAKAGKSS